MIQISADTPEQKKALIEILATAHGIAFTGRDRHGLPPQVNVTLEWLETLRAAFFILGMAAAPGGEE